MFNSAFCTIYCFISMKIFSFNLKKKNVLRFIHLILIAGKKKRCIVFFKINYLFCFHISIVTISNQLFDFGFLFKVFLFGGPN